MSTTLSKTREPSTSTRVPSPIPMGVGQDQHIIEIITSRFQELPRMDLFMKDPQVNREAKIRNIVTWAYYVAKRLGGVFLSRNRQTVILYYLKKDFGFSLADYLRYAKILIKTVGILRIWRVYQHEQEIKSHRKKLDNYIYIWFLAQDKDYKELAGLKDVLDHIQKLSNQYQLPMLIETTNRATLIMYRRVGFEVYKEWKDPQSGITFWYLERLPAKAESATVADD